MKARTIYTALALLLAFGIAVQAFADGGPNPGVPADKKTIGPKVKGTLIVGWKYVPDEALPNTGQVDAFLYIDGRLYASVLMVENPEDVFLDTVSENVTVYEFPHQIVLDYKMPDTAIVRVLANKDVVKFTVVENIPNLGNVPSYILSYRHMIHCEVQLSFLIPK